MMPSSTATGSRPGGPAFWITARSARARTDGAAAPPAKRVSACCALMFSTRDIVQVHYRGEGVFILVSGRSISLRKKFKPQNL